MTASPTNLFSFTSIGVEDLLMQSKLNQPPQLTPLSSFKCFGGSVTKYQHNSKCCQSTMSFSIFIPNTTIGKKLPTLLFLAGMTCSDDSFIQQAGAIKRASELGMILVCPDTSPRNTGILGEDDSFDIGSGASFYVDATEPKWSSHYQMYTYITQEFRELILTEFPIDQNLMSISGHSMGGNAALVISMRHPAMFRSCSAFAPVCNPSENQWGHKVFQAYLGDDKNSWNQFDSVKVLRSLGGVLPLPVLIDQGDRDFFSRPEAGPEFDALTPYRFLVAAKNSVSQGGYPLQFHMREGYNHFFYFIQSFIDDHLNFHAKNLNIN